jgi:uncharacterized protein
MRLDRATAWLEGRSWALALVLLLASCAPRSTGAMVSIPPPDWWGEEIRAHRTSKDQQFRESEDSPLLPEDRAAFSGLEYWDPDPRYYFVGPLHSYVEPVRFDIVSTAGTKRPCEKLGWIAFTVDGQEQRLEVYRLLDSDGELFLPFSDATTGRQTYPAGRYVDLAGPAGGPYVLDFNKAYNPSCAYGAPERFQCPVTPPENRLGVRVEAGERGYRGAPRSEGAGA